MLQTTQASASLSKSFRVLLDPESSATSLVHHEVPGAELIVVQVVHREEVVGADVALHRAILPHHIS